LLTLLPGNVRADTPVAPQPGEASTPAAESAVAIQSPTPGQALQGSVPVVVDTTVEGFKSVELAFSYAYDATDTWFFIYQGLQPVTGTMLALWDTSTLTDGDYTLRMLVSFADGSQKTALVPNIRVRNYSAIETNTPAPVQPTVTRPPAVTQQPTPVPTEKPTQPLSAATATRAINPAEISPQQVLGSIGKGAAAVFGLFALGWLYQAVRKTGRRK